MFIDSKWKKKSYYIENCEASQESELKQFFLFLLIII